MSTGGGPDFRGAQGVQSGDRNFQTNIYGSVTLMAPLEVSWPVRVGAVPAPAACYQDREETRLLTAAAAEGETAVVTQVLAGLGGVGKTQLAAAHARARKDVDLLVWVPAGSRDAILTGYARAAAQLGHQTADGPDEAARWLLAWLQGATERSWLIVLDDLGDPADLQGLWPDGPRGQTVVTTRRADPALTGPGTGRRQVGVGVFTPRQARAYLAAKLDADLDTDSGSARMREADELAADLGYLPLALAQAGAFILDRGDTCTRYRARLATRRRRLAEVFPQDALADDYRVTVAMTWSISIDTADALAPAGLARPVLELASVLDSNGIPTDLFSTPAAMAYAATHPTPSGPGDAGPSPESPILTVDAGEAVEVEGQDLWDALHNLARLSLITLDPAAGATGVRVHGLVQRATLEQLIPDRRRALHRASADGLAAIWPDIERDAELGQVLRANAATLAAHAGADLWQPEAHGLLWRTGRSLGECGLGRASISHWTQIVSGSRDRLGPDHADTLAARGDLAYWRGEAGDSVGAAAAFEELVADLVRVLGPAHPDTLLTRGSLARWRGEAGDLVGAITAFEEQVTDLVRALGADHTDTLEARGNLAYWRGEAGDPVGAAAAFEELLTDRLRVLGADHPQTLTTRANVAERRGEAGDPAGAVAAYEELLLDRIQVLGADHPDTLTTRMSLAYWRGEAGDPVGAATAFEQLLPDCLRLLGPDHPNTFGIRHNIARWRGETGDPAGAVAAFEQLLTDRLRVAGPDHPHTFGIRASIARCRAEAGDPAGAVAAAEQLLTDLVRVLGPDHPRTVTTRTSLSHYRDQASQLRSE